MRVLVTGPQGSGKSTQAALLAQDLGVPYIQLGEILRALALIDDSQTSQIVKKALSEGTLAPFDLVAKIVNKRVQQKDCDKGFVLDGYPRSRQDIKNFNQNLDYVVYLKISEAEGVKRLLARGRLDDTPNLIRARLKNYREQTAPIIEYFTNLGILIEVNGEKTVSKIHKDIVKKLQINDIHQD